MVPDLIINLELDTASRSHEVLRYGQRIRDRAAGARPDEDRVPSKSSAQGVRYPDLTFRPSPPSRSRMNTPEGGVSPPISLPLREFRESCASWRPSPTSERLESAARGQSPGVAQRRPMGGETPPL